MEPFHKFRSAAVPVPGRNIDTDQILPARFLSKPRSEGFGQYLFHDLRFRADGNANDRFPLNDPRYEGAHILIGEENFGCGSSRENAAWAIHDYGIRVVIAPSFGDIFYSNSLKNGLLPVVLDGVAVHQLMAAMTEQGQTLEVDLAAQIIRGPGETSHAFAIDPFSKECLLKGIDELDYALAQMSKIEEFERLLPR